MVIRCQEEEILKGIGLKQQQNIWAQRQIL